MLHINNLPELTRELSNPKLNHNTDREEVNKLIYDASILYILKYFNIQTPLKTSKDAYDAIIRHITLYNTNEEYFFPVSCALDIHSTCSIVKEIIFNSIFNKSPKNNENILLDIGSGIGILSFAGIIAMQRQKCENILSLSIDRIHQHTQQTTQTLSTIFPEVSVESININIQQESFDLILEKYQHNIKLWISETISTLVPTIDVQNPDSKLYHWQSGNEEHIEDIDPFHIVLSKSLTKISNFKQRVANKDISMFPNPFNKSYIPKENDSSLKLSTSDTNDQNLLLHEVGKEFKKQNFPILSWEDERWPKQISDYNY